MKNSTLAHEWANQLHESGKGSNMFYDGAIIYSYGNHFPIAARAGSVTYFTTDGYSSSTSTHKNYVLQSIHGDIVYCKNPKQALDGDHDTNIQFIKDELEFTVSQITIRPHSRGKLIEQLKQEVANAGKYIYYTHVSGKWLSVYEHLLESGEYVAFAQEAAEREKKAKAAREKALEKKFKEAVKKFKACETNSVYTTHTHPETYLRLNGMTVDSSLGMSIHRKEFKALYKFWKAGRLLGKEVHDGYKVIEATPERVKIGCHLIPASEIEFIKSQLL